MSLDRRKLFAGGAFGLVVLMASAMASCSRNDPRITALADDPVANHVPFRTVEVFSSVESDGQALGIRTVGGVIKHYEAIPPADAAELVENVAAFAAENGWTMEPGDSAVVHGTKQFDDFSGQVDISYSSELDRIVVNLYVSP